MSGIKAIIFDVFETLAHNRPDLWQELMREVCKKQKLDVSPSTLWQEWRTNDLQFRRTRTNMEAPEKSPPFKTYAEAWRESFRQTFFRLGLRGDPDAATHMAVRAMSDRDLFPDVKPALAAIGKRYRTGILSNADDAYLIPMFQRHGLRFETVVTSERAKAYKPDPRAFRHTLEEMGLTPDDAIYVGDNPYDDILGAKNIGMRVAWINRAGAPRDASRPAPDYEISSLTELLPAIDRGGRRE